MQTTGLAKRLWEAFFPPTPPKRKVSLRRWQGTEDEFFDYLNRKGFDAKVAPEDNNPYVTIYTSKETGEVIGTHVRWPGRNHYYTMTVS